MLITIQPIVDYGEYRTQNSHYSRMTIACDLLMNKNISSRSQL